VLVGQEKKRVSMWQRALNLPIQLSELCKKLDIQFKGPNLTISGFCSFFEPKSNCLTFFQSNSLQDFKLPSLSLAVIVREDVFDSLTLPENVAILCSQNPLYTFVKAVNFCSSKVIPWGTIESSCVSSSAKFNKQKVYIGFGVVIKNNVQLDDYVYVGDLSYIGEGVKIGEGTILQPGVKVLDNTEIGRNCFIGAGSVIGSEGFGYVRIDGSLEKIPHIGRVVVEDDVEIGSNVCIDRATLGETRIGKGSKIDNLVQVGHNVKIGKNCIICGQVGIAGSSELGDECVVGGQAGVSDHVKVSSGTRLAARSGVTKSITVSGDYAGVPAIPARDWRKLMVFWRNLIKNNCVSKLKIFGDNI